MNKEFEVNKELSLTTRTMTVESFVNEMKTNKVSTFMAYTELSDNPNFSNFIEMLILKIPTSLFYAQSDTRGNLKFLNNNKLLNAVYLFISEKMTLSDMNFYTEFNGLTFSELPIFAQNNILFSTMNIAIINPNTSNKMNDFIYRIVLKQND